MIGLRKFIRVWSLINVQKQMVTLLLLGVMHKPRGYFEGKGVNEMSIILHETISSKSVYGVEGGDIPEILST